MGRVTGEKLREEALCRFPECRELYVTIHQLAELFTNLLESKDVFTKNHSEIVAVVAYLIGRKLGLSPQVCDVLHIAGHLHDVGKVRIPRRILQKKGPLNSEEYELVKKHPEWGVELLKPIKVFHGKGGVLEMILHHHERWDGRGYPSGLAGEEIPLGARILAIADAFSAMVCIRPYRKPLLPEEALLEIKKNAGTQFDPALVDIFEEAYPVVSGWIAPLVEEQISCESTQDEIW